MTDIEPENGIDLLKRSVFRDLPPGELDELAQNFQSMIAGPNEFIFKEGDPASFFYIVASGRVRIFVRHANRIEREFSIRGPGEHFGETALLAGATRSANALSVAQTRLLALPKDRFDRLMRDYPDLSRNFVREMRGWLLKDQEIIEEGANAVFRTSRSSPLDFFLLFGVSVLLAVTFNISNPYGISLLPESPDTESISSISPAAAMEDYRQGGTLIVDAMPANFYHKRHIKGALNMPSALFDIVYLMSFSEEDRAKRIVIYGNSISRPYDLEIANKLVLRGHTNVNVLNGGLNAWEANGYPVDEKDSK